MSGIAFHVTGTPIPKQSYRATHGGGYTDPRVKAWQYQVMLAAHQAIISLPAWEPYTCALKADLQFLLPDRRHRDLDNLSKGVLDAMNKIVYVDDNQIEIQHMTKEINKEHPGVYICVTPLLWSAC